jgi:hypothetical protein
MRPKGAQLAAGSAAILAILLAAAFLSSRTQERSAAVESANSSPAGAPSLVQASEQEDVDPEQPAQEHGPPPILQSSLASAVEPHSPSLLPRAINDPLASSFAAEGADPSWSDLAQAQILGEISRLSGLSLITIDVECRTTLCRVQSVFPTTDARARQRILGVAATLGLEPRPVVAVSNKSGNVAFLAYFGRSKTPMTQSQ